MYITERGNSLEDEKHDTRTVLKTTEDTKVSLYVFLDIETKGVDAAGNSNFSVLSGSHNLYFNGIDLVNLVGLEDPTVEEASKAFKKLTLRDVEAGSNSKVYNEQVENSNFNVDSWNMSPRPHFIEVNDADEDEHGFHFQYPTHRHNGASRKYTSGVLPTYIVIGVIAILAHVLRRKVFHHRESLIKLSNDSSLTLEVLILGLLFDLFYLSYLVSFRFFSIFSHKYYLLFFVVTDQALEVEVFYATMCVFVQGCITLHFDKKVLWSRFSLLTMSLYIMSVFFIRVYT